jgi:apolipoprotein N-acyltransferase
MVPVPGDYDDGEIGGMNGRGNQSTRRKPAPVPPCPLQTPHVARTRTRAAEVGSQRLTACATARPKIQGMLYSFKKKSHLTPSGPAGNYIFYIYLFSQTIWSSFSYWSGIRLKRVWKNLLAVLLPSFYFACLLLLRKFVTMVTWTEIFYVITEYRISK